MELIVKITKDKVWLSEEFSLSFKETNLESAHFELRDDVSIYCNSEIVDWDKSELKLTIRFLEYDVREEASFKAQKPKFDIHKLIFVELHWPFWSSIMTSYQKSTFKLIDIVDSLPEVKRQHKNVIRLTFKVALKNVHFRAGYVLIRKKFKWSDDKIEIRISNSHVLPEYEFIKPLFINYFSRNTIDVKATFELLGTKVISVKAYSGQIASITEDVIDTIKLKEWKGRFQGLTNHQIDKSLFTIDDIFGDPKPVNSGNLTPDSFEELFRIICRDRNIRNGPQIIYLSGKLHNYKQTLWITMQPIFGFVFKAEGGLMDHYIWELLDSHATYVWSFSKTLSSVEQLDQLSTILAMVRTQGRTVYKNSIRHHNDPVLNIVNHIHSKSDVIDHFPKWKMRIEQLLV